MGTGVTDLYPHSIFCHHSSICNPWAGVLGTRGTHHTKTSAGPHASAFVLHLGDQSIRDWALPVQESLGSDPFPNQSTFFTSLPSLPLSQLARFVYQEVRQHLQSHFSKNVITSLFITINAYRSALHLYNWEFSPLNFQGFICSFLSQLNKGGIEIILSDFLIGQPVGSQNRIQNLNALMQM